MHRFCRRQSYRWLWFWLGLNAASLVVQRLAFGLLFGETDLGDGAFWSQLVLGFRFDLATLPFLTFPMLLAWPWFVYYGRLPRAARLSLRVSLVSLFPLYLWGQLTMLAGSVYYAYNQKLLGWEYFAYLSDLPVLLLGSLEREPWVAAPALISIPCMLWLGWRLCFHPQSVPGRLESLAVRRGALAGRKSGHSRPSLRPLGWLRAGSWTMALVGLSLVAVRGGVQENPLRTADALRTGKPALDALPLNSVFTVLQDWTERDEFRTFFERETNIAFVQQLLGRRSDFVRPGYPLVRRMPARRPYGLVQPNIVLVIVESLTAQLMAPYGGDPRLTPNLNRIARRGILFQDFFAAGGRSANGVFAMLTGIPDRSGRTILRSPQVFVRFGGVARLLRQRGYRTLFYHGGDLRFDNLNRVLPHFGFERIVGSAELDASRCCRIRNAWGYDDAETAKRLLVDVSGGEQPFFGVLFTLNTHHPFFVPGDAPRPFAGQPQGDFLDALHYTDRVVGEFVERMLAMRPERPTVFVITGDHAHHRDLDYLADRKVPLMLYAPGRIRASVRQDIASQLDVVPTVLALAGGDLEYAAMGRDLTLPPPDRPFAFFAGGSGTNVVGWVEGDHIFSEWLLAPVRGLYTIRRPLTMRNEMPARPELARELRARTLHFHQFARMLERENRAWPPPGN